MADKVSATKIFLNK